VAVAGVPGELRAAHRLARLPAGHRGGVQQPEAVTEARRDERQIVDAAPDLRRERAQPTVVARLVDQLREQVAQPPPRQRQELTIVGHAQQDLRDRERDQLAIGQLRRTSGATTGLQEVVDLHIECDDEGVEGGEHEGLQGRRCCKQRLPLAPSRAALPITHSPSSGPSRKV
jgi:hypothetical protein